MNGIPDGKVIRPGDARAAKVIKFAAASPRTVDPLNLETLSLRDWFAGQCLPGLMHNGADCTMPTRWAHNELADAAYMMADAMLAARERKGGA